MSTILDNSVILLAEATHKGHFADHMDISPHIVLHFLLTICISKFSLLSGYTKVLKWGDPVD